MTFSRMTRRAVLGVCGFVLLTCGCDYLFELPSNYVIKDNTLNIAQGGGSVQILFSGIAGQQITITLTGRNAGMVPYAELISPGGGSTIVPEAGTAENSVNTGDATLAETGGYSLIVYDDAGLGGAVTIRVELVQ